VILNGEAIGDGWHQLDLKEELCKVAASAVEGGGEQILPSWCAATEALRSTAEHAAIVSQQSIVSEMTPVFACIAAILVLLAVVLIVVSVKQNRGVSGGIEISSLHGPPCLPSAGANVASSASALHRGISLL
jgi:hypothetical protein